jgi:phage terminase large subunit GpA-like protein
MVEIMDNMSPASPIRHTGFMKAAQIGATAGACENVIAYWIDESPAEILVVTATEALLERWAVKRLDPLIDSCNFRHKIYSQTESKNTRRLGDKVFSKEFVGGNLNMTSAQSASGLRSDAVRILIRDEVDGAPKLLRTGEGHWMDVSYARTFAWDDRKKVMDISTPTTWEDSEINVIFQRGDQRKYFVPCPLCGKMQILRFGNDKTQYGLKAETKAGEFVSAYYLCDYCHDAIFNHNKVSMLTAGKWEPTAKSSSPYLRTYQLSSLYSPVGMLSWSEIWNAYKTALSKPDGMRSFVNLYLGLPYKESGSRPDIKKVIELRGGYRSERVPP